MIALKTWVARDRVVDANLLLELSLGRDNLDGKIALLTRDRVVDEGLRG